MRTRKLVVAALVRDARHRILLSRRRADQPMPLKWELPGGKIEPGESPEEALVREIREELGCAVEVQGVEEVIFHRYEAFDLLMLVYRASLSEVPKPVQVAELAWVAPDDLERYDVLPADRPLMRKLAR